MLALALAVALTTLAGAGCGDEDAATGAALRTVTVDVVDRDTAAPVAGVKIAVMNDDNVPVAAPLRTGVAGRVVFDEVPAGGSLQVLAFAGDSLRVHRTAAWPPAATAVRSIAASPAAPSGAATTDDVRLQVTVTRLTQPGGLPRITGTVVDADTGEPLAGVFVGLSPGLAGYRGRTEVSDDVTLADGVFRVSEILFARAPGSNQLFQVLPLVFTCAGYRPLNWRHQPPPGNLNLDIQGVEIALQRDTGGGSSLSGCVVYGDRPAVGVAVGLGSVGQVGTKAAGWPGRVALTDSSGRYRFTDLPPGGYAVEPGYRVDDDWYLPNQPSLHLWQVDPDQDVVADTLRVVREILPVEPPDSARLTAPPDSLAWTAVAEADSYRVTLDGQEQARVAGTSLSDLQLDLAPGWHQWRVYGFTTGNEVVGYTGIGPTFAIASPDRPRP